MEWIFDEKNDSVAFNVKNNKATIYSQNATHMTSYDDLHLASCQPILPSNGEYQMATPETAYSD